MANNLTNIFTMLEQATSSKIYTKGDYKKLSDRIRNNPKDIASADFEMLQALRLTYKNSLAIVFNTLDKLAHDIDKDCVCTYRIKRIESIVSKLLRFPDMEVQRVADIAGCRCIMTNTNQAVELFEKIKKSQNKLPFSIKGDPDKHNYVNHPKDDGYRSIHLIVQLNDENKKVIEIQIRSLEHHNWATLVEISDVIFNSKLKEYGQEGEPELYEFHKILSKRDSDFTIHDYTRIAEISGKYKYLEKIGSIFSSNTIELRQQRNKLKMNKICFFLISTGSNGKPLLQGFKNFDDAEAAYFEWFSNNPDNKNIVLTHLNRTSFDKLSIAYSNYFLTYNATTLRILQAISIVATNAYNHFALAKFKKNYKAFWYIVTIWFGDKLKEANFFNHDIDIRRSKQKKSEWSSSILSSVYSINKIVIDMQKRFLTSPFYFIMKLAKTEIDKKLSRGIVYLRRD
ncbi:MAG: RelA/SpoT domain-containing protein [Prevotellaceae bacterium]|nr:RelA/SpoT domain-containing protein [Prevotellaceae bacterium]